MSLTEKLLAIDTAKYKEKKVDTLEIKRLSQLTGEPFKITIQEMDDKRIDELRTMMLDSKGRVDYSQNRKVNAILCVEGIIEPKLGDEKLLKHFGVATAKELAETLFKGSDLGVIADAILKLGNITDEEVEEEKN